MHGRDPGRAVNGGSGEGKGEGKGKGKEHEWTEADYFKACEALAYDSVNLAIENDKGEITYPNQCVPVRSPARRFQTDERRPLATTTATSSPAPTLAGRTLPTSRRSSRSSRPPFRLASGCASTRRGSMSSSAFCAPLILKHAKLTRDVARRCLIAGPEHSPYANGLFEFDIFLPLRASLSPRFRVLEIR